MTSLLMVKSQPRNSQLAIQVTGQAERVHSSLPQTRKSINPKPPNFLESQAHSKELVNKPRSVSYNVKNHTNKHQNKAGNDQLQLETSEGSVDTTEVLGKSKYSQEKNRRQTLMMTGSEFEAKKLQISDLGLQQKMDMLKRLCNLKAVKTDKDILLIFDILKENQYIKYLKEVRGEQFILSKVCPHVKIVNKRQGEINYDQEFSEELLNFLNHSKDIKISKNNNYFFMNELFQDCQSQGFYVVIQGECEGRMKNYMTGESRLITDKYVEGTEFGNIEMLDQKTRIQTMVSKTDSWLMYFDTHCQKQYFAAIQRTQLEYLIDMLNNFSCFQNYGRRNLLNFLPFFTFQVYTRNQKVYTASQTCDYIYFIISGDFKVYQKVYMNQDMTLDQLLKVPSLLITDEKDRYFRSIEIALLGTGQVFGEEEIIMLEENRKQEVICSSTQGQVLLLHKEDYDFKFANDDYFREIFKNLVSSKRRFREKRLKEIENVSKTTINTQEQNYNKNIIGKRIKLKLEDRVLDIQKKGLIKQKLENQLFQKELQQLTEQQENPSSSQISSPLQSSRKQGSPMASSRKKKSKIESPSNLEKKSDFFGNSEFLGNTNSNYKENIKLTTLNSLTEQTNRQFESSILQKEGQFKNLKGGREIIPAALILKENQINIFSESSKQFLSGQRSPKDSNRSPKFRDSSRLRSLGSTEQLNTSQNLWLSNGNNDRSLSSTLNMRRTKQPKNNLDKSDFYGVQREKEGIGSGRCDTSPSRKKKSKQFLTENTNVSDQKSVGNSFERFESKFNSNKSSIPQSRNRSNQWENQAALDPLFITNNSSNVDESIIKKMQSVFYNNQVNLQQNSPSKYENNQSIMHSFSEEQEMQAADLEEQSSFKEESSGIMTKKKSNEYLHMSQPKQKTSYSIIRSPQDEPQKIYDPTGINKYLRRIFYGKGRKKLATEYEDSNEQNNERCYTSTQRSQTTERKRSTERRNTSLEEKMIKQFRKDRKENSMKANFQEVMKVVDKKNLKVHLYKKNLIKNVGEKEKYNSFIKPPGVKKDQYCFEYINARLSSTNLDEENYQKYAQMVQQEYQKFKQQNIDLLEQAAKEEDEEMDELGNDFKFQMTETDGFQTLTTNFNQNKTHSDMSSTAFSQQLHNVRGSSYSKKRKILKIVNDPTMKKVINLSNGNKTGDNSNLQSPNSHLSPNYNNNKKNIFSNKPLTSTQCNNNNFTNQVQTTKQNDSIQLNELLKTRDIIQNCFIPYSNGPHFKRLQQHRSNSRQKQNLSSLYSDSKKQPQNQIYAEYIGDQVLGSPSPFRLTTLN